MKNNPANAIGGSVKVMGDGKVIGGLQVADTSFAAGAGLRGAVGSAEVIDIKDLKNIMEDNNSFQGNKPSIGGSQPNIMQLLKDKANLLQMEEQDLLR